MAYEQNDRKELPSTLLDNTNMRITAPSPSTKGKFANLSFKVFKGNPRLYVRTNNPNDNDNYGTIAVPMTLPVFETFMNAWEASITAPPETKYTIECENFPKGSRPGPGVRPELLHVIHVGKDSDGVVSIMVVDKTNDRRDKVKFEIGAPRFVTVIEKGQPMDRARASEYFSRVWIDLLRSVVRQECVRTWEKPAQFNGNRQGGGQRQNNYQGGGQRNQYQGGGNQGGNQGGDNGYQNQAPAQSGGQNDFGSDDIPF